MPQPNEELSVIGKIDNVSPVKTGTSTKDGRTFNWTLYDVKIDGQNYRTFDDRYQGLVGQSKEWKFKIDNRQGKDGKWYENRNLQNLPKEGAGGISPDQEKRIHDKLDKIIGLLEQPQSDKPEDFEPVPPKPTPPETPPAPGSTTPPPFPQSPPPGY